VRRIIDPNKVKNRLKELIQKDIKALKAYSTLIKNNISLDTRAKLKLIKGIATELLVRIDTIAEYEAAKNNKEIEKMLQEEEQDNNEPNGSDIYA
jgi:hypothetical protein